MESNCKLQGLSGIKAKTIDAVYFNKSSEVYSILKNQMAATSSGDSGAINIWIDDEKKIRCESYKNGIPLESKIYVRIESVVKWTKEWLNKVK